MLHATRIAVIVIAVGGVLAGIAISRRYAVHDEIGALSRWVQASPERRVRLRVPLEICPIAPAPEGDLVQFGSTSFLMPVGPTELVEMGDSLVVRHDKGSVVVEPWQSGTQFAAMLAQEINAITLDLPAELLPALNREYQAAAEDPAMWLRSVFSTQLCDTNGKDRTATLSYVVQARVKVALSKVHRGVCVCESPAGPVFILRGSPKQVGSSQIFAIANGHVQMVAVHAPTWEDADQLTDAISTSFATRR